MFFEYIHNLWILNNFIKETTKFGCRYKEKKNNYNANNYVTRHTLKSEDRNIE